MIDPPGELDEFAFQGARSLSEAVANEEYERAARLRDEIARRKPKA